MKLENEFTVPVDVDTVYNALNDPERVAPCFPGATLDSHDGDQFTGTVKVKLGPISMTYKGKGTFVERDAVAHRVVVDAQGRDARGNGTASAKATLTMSDEGGRTKVTVLTEMQVTGRPAQFGRGVISDVGDKILGQFAQCLADELGSVAPSNGAPSNVAPSDTVAGTDTASPGGGGGPTPSAVGGSDASAPSTPSPVASGSGAPAPMEMPTTVAGAAKATEGARPGGSASTAAASTVAASTGALGGALSGMVGETVGAVGETVTGTVGSVGGTVGDTVDQTAQQVRRAPAEAIDLLESSRDALLKRLLPVGAVGGVLALLVAIAVILRGRSR